MSHEPLRGVTKAPGYAGGCLLRDNLFERGGGQDYYLELIEKLLDWGFGIAPNPAFTELPPALHERFIQERVIPHVHNAKDFVDAAFESLLVEARRGNDEARKVLEDLADELGAPNRRIPIRILNQPEIVNADLKLSHRFLELLLKNDSLLTSPKYRINTLVFLETFSISEKWPVIPYEVRRWIAYIILCGNGSIEDDLLECTSLIKLVRSDKLLSTAILIRQRGWVNKQRGNPRGLFVVAVFMSFITSDTADLWNELRLYSQQGGYEELEALAAYCCNPNAETVIGLQNAYKCLSNCLHQGFSTVLQQQDMVLGMLFSDTSDALKQIDEQYYQSVCEKKRDIFSAIRENDYDMLNELDAWPFLDYYITIGGGYNWSWVPAAIRESSEDSCRYIMSMVLPPHQLFRVKMNYEVQKALLRRFSIALCSNSNSMHYALISFVHEPREKLVKLDISYPSTLPNDLAHEEESIVREVLERIQTFVGLGGAFVDMYSLLPFVFSDADHTDVCAMQEGARVGFDAVKARGNDCALLGVILVLLTGENSLIEKVDLSDDLNRLMKKMDPGIWHGYYSRQFSLAGKLLAHNVGMDAYGGTEYEREHYDLSRSAILQELEALPADLSKMPVPGDPTCF